MTFAWLCPGCEGKHFYGGSKTTRATTNCPQTKTKYKVWQYKLVVEEPTLENLHPPVEVGEKPKKYSSMDGGESVHIASSHDSKPTININSMPNEYWEYCDSSDAKRAWNRAKFGRVHRGTITQLKKDVKEVKMDLEMIALMKKKGDYRLVMKELEEKLKERREKNEKKI